MANRSKLGSCKPVITTARADYSPLLLLHSKPVTSYYCQTVSAELKEAGKGSVYSNTVEPLLTELIETEGSSDDQKVRKIKYRFMHRPNKDLLAMLTCLFDKGRPTVFNVIHVGLYTVCNGR